MVCENGYKCCKNGCGGSEFYINFAEQPHYLELNPPEISLYKRLELKKYF